MFCRFVKAYKMDNIGFLAGNFKYKTKNPGGASTKHCGDPKNPISDTCDKCPQWHCRLQHLSNLSNDDFCCLMTFFEL